MHALDTPITFPLTFSPSDLSCSEEEDVINNNNNISFGNSDAEVTPNQVFDDFKANASQLVQSGSEGKNFLDIAHPSSFLKFAISDLQTFADE